MAASAKRAGPAFNGRGSPTTRRPAMSPPVSLDSRGAGLDDEDEYDEMCRWPVLSDDFVRGPLPAGARGSALIAETLAVMAHLGADRHCAEC